MKSIYKKGAALAAAALMTVAFAGCGGGDKSASKGPKDTLTVGITNFADSLEPTDNYFGWQVMRYGIGECLVHFDSKMNAEPWIAESWKVSDDKMSWTFKIKDIKFSNGTPVTGEAVKKSIERTFAKSPRAKAMFELDHITADGQNVTIYTKKPIATLPGMLGDPLFIIVDVDSDGKVDFAKQGQSVQALTWLNRSPRQNVNWMRTRIIMRLFRSSTWLSILLMIRIPVPWHSRKAKSI